MSHALVLALTLAATVAQAQDHYIDIDGGRLWYEECGSASPSRSNVVLLHDGLVHSITWNGMWSSLCSRYHVVRYDRRGYGKSTPARAPFVPDDDLAAVMRQTHMDRAILIGSSSGAGLALDFAVSHPTMTVALMLIGPVVHGMATTAYFTERGNRNNAPLDHGDVAGAATNWSTDRFQIGGDDPGARQQLRDALISAPQNFQGSGGFERRPSPPTAARLPEIAAPTLVVVGEDDIADVFAYAGAIEAMVPVSSLEVWKDVGHLIQMQKPTALVTRLDRFVALAERPQAPVQPAALAAYVGQYGVLKSSGRIFIEGDHLVLEIPGAPYYRLFAASDTEFFLRTGESRIEFRRDAAGHVTSMIIHHADGTATDCPRMTT
jgi:3-oxoadipate enol-lactonase